MEAHWGDDVWFDFNTVDNLVSSFKYVGDFDDWTRDTLTMYPRVFFRGADEEFFDVGGNVQFLPTQRSVVVTGITPWTLYT